MDTRELTGIVLQIPKHSTTQEVETTLEPLKCGSSVRGTGGEILAEGARPLS
jgi:hypothetical protein